MNRPCPGLLISAVRSGAGKTTVTLGLLRALARAGTVVQPYKCGPDYIDPAFHAAAAGRASYNLDSWAMSGAMVDGLAGLGHSADLSVAEGSMGLFDGVAGVGGFGIGASADIAARLGWPVILVLDVSGQAQSAAAMALGFARYRSDVEVAGVILNRVASVRHGRMVRSGLQSIGMPVLGELPKNGAIGLPERHLGLVQAAEHSGLNEVLNRLADFVEAHVDVTRLRQLAKGSVGPGSAVFRPPAQRIALARDAAFSFAYPHMLEGWLKAGAEVLPFSPLADEAPDPTADLVWLPGGYPELHAGRLAAASRFMAGLRRFAKDRPVHGECGGYMVLGAGLIDADGQRHEMAGLLDLVTSYQSRKMHLGYRRAVLRAAMPGFAAGDRLAGHEFHYSTILSQTNQPLAAVTDANGDGVTETGSTKGLVSGSFFHLIAGDA